MTTHHCHHHHHHHQHQHHHRHLITATMTTARNTVFNLMRGPCCGRVQRQPGHAPVKSQPDSLFQNSTPACLFLATKGVRWLAGVEPTEIMRAWIACSEYPAAGWGSVCEAAKGGGRKPLQSHFQPNRSSDVEQETKLFRHGRRQCYQVMCWLGFPIQQVPRPDSNGQLGPKS